MERCQCTHESDRHCSLRSQRPRRLDSTRVHSIKMYPIPTALTVSPRMGFKSEFFSPIVKRRHAASAAPRAISLLLSYICVVAPLAPLPQVNVVRRRPLRPPPHCGHQGRPRNGRHCHAWLARPDNVGRSTADNAFQMMPATNRNSLNANA